MSNDPLFQIISTINANFPEPGKNNSSSGFRQNFSAIKEALITMQTIIGDGGGSGGGTQGPPGPPGPRGLAYVTVIESTAGTVFRPGTNTMTTLIARVFENGVEIVDPESLAELQFVWRRVSPNPYPYPNDDETWNSMHSSGAKVININMDSINSQATFFCDIIRT
jgi:hypothetical protein